MTSFTRSYIEEPGVLICDTLGCLVNSKHWMKILQALRNYCGLHISKSNAMPRIIKTKEHRVGEYEFLAQTYGLLDSFTEGKGRKIFQANTRIITYYKSVTYTFQSVTSSQFKEF